MILAIQKIKTRIAIIHNIPKIFFRNIEASTTFGNHLFPSWANTVFAPTDLKDKFEAVYDKYKALTIQVDRDMVVNAFTNSNKVEQLCANDPSTIIIKLTDLHASIQDEIKTLFLYLYNSAIKYHRFEAYAGDTVEAAINRFSLDHHLVVCPFCGIESFVNLEGQARVPFDHWLYKAEFPMAGVNFNNLVPIGKDCNARPAKGDKNVLVDVATSNRVIAYYPYLNHSGVLNSFRFINEPSINPITEADWNFSSTPINIVEQSIFDSWASTMNIYSRYKDYFRKVIFPMWQGDYKEFISDPDSGLQHATTNDELRSNFRRWKSTFKIRARPGSNLYRSFIDYLINNASEAYLFGLRENFRR